MGRLIAMGDIHGCAQTLKAMIDRLALAPGETLLVTGDFSAKGIDSNGVHQQLVDLRQRDVNLILLVGNHELMLLALQRFIGAEFELPYIPNEMLAEAEMAFLIRGNGGWATLKSYGFDRVDERCMWAFEGDDPGEHFSRVSKTLKRVDWTLPKEHLELLSTCRTHHIERNCLFVHAGLHPQFLQAGTAEAAIEAQLRDSAMELCWGREWLGIRPAFPELLVHGHTPLSCLFSYVENTEAWKDDELVFKSVVSAGALNLDSGAFLDSGHLTAVEIPETGDSTQLNFIRVPRLDPVQKDELWYVNFTS